MGRLHGPVVGGVVQVDQRVKFTKEVQSGLFYPWSNVWYVDGDDGNSAYDGRGPSTAKALPSQAIAAASDSDFIYLKSADYTESAAITLSLNDVQIVGVAPNPYQSHLDIWQGAAFTPMLTISGRGNVLANMTIRHGTDAADVVGTLISGRYNYFENVYWYGPMVAGQDVAGYRGVKITGHENRFKGCRFGNAALMRDQKNYNVTFEGQNNWFEDCIFYLGCDGTAPHFCGWRIDEGNEQKMTVFQNCLFLCYSANWGTTIAYAIHTPGDISGGIYFDSRCQFVNVTAICNTTVDQDVWIATPGATAATAASLLAKRNLGT